MDARAVEAGLTHHTDRSPARFEILGWAGSAARPPGVRGSSGTPAPDGGPDPDAGLASTAADVVAGFVARSLAAVETRARGSLRVLDIGGASSCPAAGGLPARGHAVWVAEVPAGVGSPAGPRSRGAGPAPAGALPRVTTRLEQLPFADGTFDVVVCATGLRGLLPGHDRLALWEMGRVLAAGGCLVLTLDLPSAAGPVPARFRRLVSEAGRYFVIAGEGAPHSETAEEAGSPGDADRAPHRPPRPAAVLGAALWRRPAPSPPGARDVAAACFEAEAAGRARPAESARAARGPAPPAAADTVERVLAELGAQGRTLEDLRRWLSGFEDRIQAELQPWAGTRHLGRRLLGVRIVRHRQHLPRPLRIPEWYRARSRRASWPRVSVVTPSYNAGRYLERTIRSVLEQEYESLEYIVQDGASTDGTPAILERYRARLASCEAVADGGQADALNRGFERSTGDILAFVNADDLLLPGALHYVGAFFSAHPEVDVVYGHRVIIDARDREVGRWVLPPHDTRVLSWADWIPQETLFWRRRIWDKVGASIDPTFQFALDWDLILRFRDAGARFVRLPRFLGAFRTHDEQKSARQLATVGYDEMRRIREREHGAPVSVAEVAANVRGYLLRHALYDRLYRLGLLRY